VTELVWFASLGIGEPRPAPVGTYVPLTCGCLMLYACGSRRGVVTLCWDHECQFKLGESVRIAVAYSANLRN
jgi:hypothetical protein